MIIGQIIKKHREQKGLTITELADRLGISRSYMSRIEKGDRKLNTDVLVKISEILEVPFETFYPDENKKKIYNEDEEILIIDKNVHNLEKYTNEQILEFIRLGKELTKNDDE